MLHIHNGDSTANTLTEFGFPGEHRAFQEVLMEGPAPADLSFEEWINVRAQFLADDYELADEKCEKGLREQEAWLSKFSEHEETILWFEHDLFCQINLIYLLDWFSKQRKGETRLSLICVGEFAGVEDFRGLGQLTGEQLASMFDSRHEVTDSEFELSRRAWAAYRASDPTDIARFVDGDTADMPFLGKALRLHLARFPSVKNGLGRVENEALGLVSNGAVDFKHLFPKFAAAHPTYGLGDSQFWCALKRIADASDPPIRINFPDNAKHTLNPNSYHHASFEITQTGRSILAGEKDFIDLNGIDLWLGGVHLVDGAVWRWDESNGLMSPTG